MSRHRSPMRPVCFLTLIGGLGLWSDAPAQTILTESPGQAAVISVSDDSTSVSLELVASSDHLWTGVAVSRGGRIFVNYPRWSPDVPMSMAEIVDGEPVPFPSEEWNQWAVGEPVRSRFVCVQSVVVDDQDFLWILDAANPMFSGVVVDGPKLVRVDLTTGRTRVHKFPVRTIPPQAYLNDVRVDTERQFAFITDSGTGAILIVDLNTDMVRRHLVDHPSTKAENVDIVIGGAPWKMDGRTPRIHADGIALSPDRRYLYYQALTGHTVYRVPTQPMRDFHLPAEELEAAVEVVAKSGVSDGIIFDENGYLYLSALEENAVNRLTPDGELERVIQDERLRWPDSFALGPDGTIYVTTSQINFGATPPGPYGLFRFRPLPPAPDPEGGTKGSGGP